MTFDIAARWILCGYPVTRRNRWGATIVIESYEQACECMDVDDWLADDWELVEE